MKRYTVELWEADGEPNRMPDAIFTVSVRDGLRPYRYYTSGANRALEAAMVRAERNYKRNGFTLPVRWADWYVMEESE